MIDLTDPKQNDPLPASLLNPEASATKFARTRLLLRPIAWFVLHLRRAFAWDVATVRVSAREEARLAAHGIDQDTPRHYLAWRRSLLLVVVLPLAVSALLNTLDDGEDLEYLNELGWLVTGADLLAGYLLPVTALAAALLWTRPRWSRRVLVGGFIVGFLAPILTGLVPLEWLIKLPDTGLPGVDRTMRGGIGVGAAVLYYLTLMPTILSLLPGLLRACVRIKSLLPGAILPGWLLVAGAPFYVLVLLVLFIALNQAAGSPLLLVGMALVLAAPLAYAIRARLFVRPLMSQDGRRSLARVQWVFIACVVTGVGLLLVYLFTKTVAGIHLVGLDPEKALLGPWNLARFAIEYLGRSWFMTAVAADLLLRATLSAWRHERRFQETAEAGEHARRIEELLAAASVVRKTDG